MKIDKVMNNNVVSSIDEDGQEIIVVGTGIGFQGKEGKVVDEKKMFDSLKKMFEKNAKTISLKAVEDGRTIPMDEVNDQTFAQELLGPGIAIVPSNGTVVSPINGTIATVMDTKHAVCIQGEDGLELIVHAGLDTVELNGKYYQTYKEIGDQVKAGDVLLEFDLEEITKAGYDVTTPIVITNLGDYKITKCLTGQQVKAGEEVIQLTKQ